MRTVFMLFGATICVGGAVAFSTQGLAGSRDPLQHPFSSTSIWNMPIGTGAIYVDPQISFSSLAPWAHLPRLDEEIIILQPFAPVVPIYYNWTAWNGGDRCPINGGVLVKGPIPTNFTVPSSGENNSAAILLADSRTVVQMEPLTRCLAGAYATSYVVFSQVDLYSDGITGAHGGSNLSALGGSLRVGELRPRGSAPAHTLKIDVDAAVGLWPCTRAKDCYRWPASTADGYAVGYYGSKTTSASSAMKMGALLAIPANTQIASLGLETAPAQKLAWTLQNYGAYAVDDSHGDGFGFCSEFGPAGRFATQFQNDYGYSFVARNSDNTPWSRDIMKLFKAMKIVDNNSATTIGGGGTPLQPLAVPLK